MHDQEALHRQSVSTHAGFTAVAAARFTEIEPHAAVRWADCVVPIVDCQRDLRTIANWGRWVAVSPGALRNWCRTVRIASRRSLVFARLLRAVVLRDGSHQRLENLLDVVDRRTLLGLLRMAGFHGEDDFPLTVDEFLSRQVLVTDPDAIASVRAALIRRAVARSRDAIAPTEVAR